MSPRDDEWIWAELMQVKVVVQDYDSEEAEGTPNLGIWTTQVCRELNDIPWTQKGVAYCGRCAQYGNPRKQARAKAHAAMPTLPGLEPAYQLHPPCPFDLRKVMRILRQLEELDIVRPTVGVRIPDKNGWGGRTYDFGTRYYMT